MAFDLLVHGGELIDGSGAARRRADIGIEQGVITAIGDLITADAHRRIDASGLIVAPGFIDSHTHDDRLLLDAPREHPKLLQGVTTVVTGNCGVSLAPLSMACAPPPLDLMGADRFRYPRFADYVGELQSGGIATNAALLVGHTTLRVGAMDRLDRAANPRETAQMQAALAEALDAGAIGLSTGVYYPPAQAATTQELIDVGAPLAGGRGVLAMHIRDEADAIDAALAEAMHVGRTLQVPLVLSHHKLMGRRNHGRSAHTLALIAAAANEQAVCLDCYPYTASSTVLLPSRVAMCSDVRITWSHAEPEAAGRSLMALAAERGIDPALLAEQLQPGGAVYFAMSDEDVERILAHPLSMIGSDGLPHDAVPHPRLWGTFPRVLGHYARDRKLLSLEQAVHKMSGLPARRFGLALRGSISVGHAADVTVFDAQTIADRACYEAPVQTPIGVDTVIVNGSVVVRHGEVHDLQAGRVLLRRT